MTAISTAAPNRGTTDAGPTDSTGPHDLRRRALVLLAGAIVIVVAIRPVGPLDFYWNPLLVGLAFVAAAAVAGPRSPLWGAGLVLSAWGSSKVIENNVHVDWAGGMTMIAVGLGGLLAAWLATRGWAVTPASVAWPVVFIGLGQFLHSNTPGSGAITWYTAGLTALYGVIQLVMAARQPATATLGTPQPSVARPGR